jgi:ABC-type dipeptide transport system, periplasmic component
VTVLDLADETAGYNALQGGQVDVFANAPLALAKQVGSAGAIKALVSKPGQWTPFTMRVDQPPFDNPDVRMALRSWSIASRSSISPQRLGQVANDVFAPWDPCYDSSLKRGRDLEQAKFLLKKAGQENLSLELVTRISPPA